MSKEPLSGIPFRRIVFVQFLATITAGMLWICMAILIKMDYKLLFTGLIESGIMIIFSVIFLTLFSAHKKRPIATLATLWTVGSFLRFFAALGASSLLYYFAEFGIRPLLFSFLLNAMLLLLFETKVIAQHLTELGKNN